MMILLSIFSIFKKQPESGIVKVENFGSNPGNLEMYQYVPENLPDKAALVVVLHGCTQNADSIAVETGWNKLAEAHGFAVLYPQQKMTNNIKKCFNWFQNGDIQREQGEALSIKQMIDQSIGQHKLDASRVFITGISAGGAMGSVMMANYPGLFNAGAIMSGIPFGAANNLQTGLTAMQGGVVKTGQEWSQHIRAINPDFQGDFPRLAVFQGDDDPFVNKANAEELVKQYLSLHGLNEAPELVDHFNDNADVRRFLYKDAKGEAKVIYYSISNLGHAIAIHPGEPLEQGGKVATYAVDKQFHSTYWAAKFFDILN